MKFLLQLMLSFSKSDNTFNYHHCHHPLAFFSHCRTSSFFPTECSWQSFKAHSCKFINIRTRKNSLHHLRFVQNRNWWDGSASFLVIKNFLRLKSFRANEGRRKKKSLNKTKLHSVKASIFVGFSYVLRGLGLKLMFHSGLFDLFAIFVTFLQMNPFYSWIAIL